MSELTVAVLIASFLGSPHCAGMCGPFMMFALGTSDAAASPNRRFNLIAYQHMAYHGSRLIAYALLGIAAGMIGAALELGGAWLGFQRTATMVAGAAMIVFGLVACGRYLGLRIPYLGTPRFLQRWLTAGNRRAARLKPTRRAALVGLLTTFMPCGWLYAFLFAAAGTGTAVGGVLTMTFFWLGTVPVLMALGIGLQKLAGPVRAKLPLVTGIFIVFVGLYAISHRASANLQSWAETRSPAAAPETVVDEIRQLDVEQMPCCQPAGPTGES